MRDSFVISPSAVLQRFKRLAAILFVWLFFVILPFHVAHAAGWIPLTGAVHVHSSEFSTGAHTLNELIRMARTRGVDVVVLNDHDQIALSYGIPPFRNLFSWTFSRNSVLKRGAGKYLKAVKKADEENPDILLIPALESSPFYYWTGSFWEGTLTAHGLRKHMHVIGLTETRDIEGLPILHNGLSTHYFFDLLPRFFIFMGVFFLSVFLMKWGGFYRKVGSVMLILGLLGAFNAHPFKSSLYDPYQGDQDTDPHQELIDYVEERGGMVFWAHPEANYGASDLIFNKTIAGISLPRVYMKNEKYPSALIHTHNYTGFEALYGDTIHVTETGKEWDRILNQYCNGTRKKPAWGICGLDFHEQGITSWSELDRGQTVFWVHEKSRESVLNAMQNGRMYAVYQGGPAKISLDAFSLSSEAKRDTVISGGTIDTRGELLTVQMEISMNDSSKVPLKVDLIESGKILTTVEGETPLKITRPVITSRAKGYVRAVVQAKYYKIITNPIFYKDPTRMSP